MSTPVQLRPVQEVAALAEDVVNRLRRDIAWEAKNEFLQKLLAE